MEFIQTGKQKVED